MVDAFGRLRRRANLREVDLVGVNSPERGAFKLSFGGTRLPYFGIEKVPATGG